jgi:hypothetical protein
MNLMVQVSLSFDQAAFQLLQNPLDLYVTWKENSFDFFNSRNKWMKYEKCSNELSSKRKEKPNQFSSILKFHASLNKRLDHTGGQKQRIQFWNYFQIQTRISSKILILKDDWKDPLIWILALSNLVSSHWLTSFIQNQHVRKWEDAVRRLLII